MIKNTKKIIAIVGPTASGKTAIGVKLAKEFNGEIVSADSRQIFRGLDLGTGKDLSEYNGIKYHLIDICDPEEDFNLFKYIELAKLAIEDIFNRRKVPIIVGGTGLYVQALVEGFELKKGVIPDLIPYQKYGTDPENCHIDSGSQTAVRNDEWGREELEQLLKEQLQDILKKIDVEAFEKLIDKQNPYRLIRAIERAQSGEEMIKVKPDFDVLQIGLDWPREVSNERIDRRIDERFEQGMLNEVGNLISSGVNIDWLLKLGLEYKIIGNFVISNYKFLISNQASISNYKKSLKINHLELSKNFELKIKNSAEYKQMVSNLKIKSHQYAKRQVTWFKRFPEIVWLTDYKDIEKRVKEFLTRHD